MTAPGARWLAPLAVLGLPLFFVAHAFAQYYQFVPASSAAGLLLRYSVGAALVWALFSARVGVLRGAIATVITLAFYFFFGAVRDAVHGTFLWHYGILLPLWLATWLLLLLVALRRGGLRLLRYLSLLMALLFLVDACSIIRQAARRPEPPAVASCAACAKPDVYFLLFDGYSGLDQLQASFGYNNGPFLDSLRGLGFRVMPGSRSNYEDTPFSMASLFQMDYLALDRYDYTTAHLEYCYAHIYRNPVVDRFRREGYTIVNNSIFDIDGAPAPVDNTLLVSGAALISSQTLGARLYRDLYANFVSAHFPNSSANRRLQQRAYDLNELVARRTLEAAADSSGAPRFVYTHFEMPHAPYYYRADGSANPVSVLNGSLGRKDLYLGYLQYVNRYIYHLVQEIDARSKRPHVVLLLSDHGHRYVPNYYYHHSSLAAVRIPGSDYRAYSDTVAHVNQFPLLFHTLFGDPLQLKPYRSF